MNLDKKSPISIMFDLKEYKNIEFLLEQLGKEPIDHHTRALADCIPLAIMYGFNSVGPYMDKRFI